VNGTKRAQSWLFRGIRAMRYAVTASLFCALLLSAPSVKESGAAVAGPFDGNWSVVVVTERGVCDRA
jgi:hypothetical protein